MSSKGSRKLKRRMFLAGMGGGALALPMMPSLARRAKAAGGVCPKRFIVITSPVGVRGLQFWPHDNQSPDFDTSIPLTSVVPDAIWNERDAAQSVRDFRLADLPGEQISHIVGPEFNPLREKLLMLRGLDAIWYAGHSPKSTLSGYAAGGPTADPATSMGTYAHDPVPTIDHILANSPKVYESDPAHRHLHMVISRSSPTHRCPSQRLDGTDNVPFNRPLAAYDALFGGFRAEESDRPDPSVPRRLAALDWVHGQVQSLRSHRRIGQADGRRLDEHLSMLRDMEARVDASGRVTEGCMPPDGSGYAEVRNLEPEHYIPFTSASIDLMAAAVKCDLTRVGVLQLGTPSDTRNIDFLPGGLARTHHGLSHQGGLEAYEQLGIIDRWYGQQVASFLSALDTVEDPETGATYLDNTIVLWSNECGSVFDGSNTHLCKTFPVLLAGGAGAMNMGRLIDYRRHGIKRKFVNSAGGISQYRRDDWVGRLYNELLVTICQSMDLTPEEYELHGHEGLGDYRHTLNGVQQNVDDHNTDRRREKLPFIDS